MLRFLKKRREKPRTPQKSAALETPARRITNTTAECGGDFDGINRGRIGDQQPPAPNASTLTPGHESGDTTPHGQEHIHTGFAGTQGEELGSNTPDLHFAERGLNARDRGEHEGRGPGVQKPSETAPKRAPGSDTRDVVQPGRPRVKERGRVDRALGRAAAAVDLAKGPAEAFGPLKAVLESISIFYVKYQNTVGVKDKVDTLRSRIAKLEELFENPASDEKETRRREGLSIKLKDIEEQLYSLREKSALLRFVDNVQDNEDVSGLLGDLQEAVGDYMMVQQMAMYDQGCMLMDAAEKFALNNFRCAKGAEFRHVGRTGCLRGTREIVLNAIELWARDPDRSPVYWLNGLAGTGKSTIAKTVAERLVADSRLGASFFCSRDFEDRRNLQLIFPTLATQLARRYTDFRSTLIPLIQSDPEIAYVPLYYQMDRLIVQPLKRSGISTVIVIDALDECEDEEPASAILFVLGQLLSEIPKVKFFLTGRPEPRISQGFRLPLVAKMTDVFVLHNIKPSQVDRDIRLFFRNSFLELVGRRSGLENWPTEEQLDHLCTRAAGLFVYAVATVRFVDNNKRNPRKQLDLLLESQRIGAREGKTLDSLYTSILQEAFGDDGPEDDAKIRSVLGAVILAVNPLSPSAVATLLGFDAEDVLPLLSSINSLLILQDAHHPVKPFHKSFPDFVTDQSRCINKRFHISPPAHHSPLLIGCLDLMCRKLEKNMCKLPDAVANSDVSDLKERAERYIDPALRYACLSWHMHLTDADTIPTLAPTVAPILHRFMEKKFLFWLEVLSVCGAVRNAVEALQVTTDWLEESPTLDLANDCFRFVTGYFGVIDASAPHIYHSALAFSPRKSIVRTLYGSHVHPFARVVHGLPVSWDANTAVATRTSGIEKASWSPCNRFIAIAWAGIAGIEILDSATLQRLQILELLRENGMPMSHDALIFSPDSRILTCFGQIHSDGELLVVSWDLQTGGVASVISWKGQTDDVLSTHSITYSTNGRMVGICCWQTHGGDIIFILDVTSGAYMHSHSPTRATGHVTDIWTHGESLRFAIVGAKNITIWEVGFASDAIPTEVETLPAPEITGHAVCPSPREVPPRPYHVQFLPDPCLLALVFEDEVVVWDARNSKFLLHSMGTNFCTTNTFSSNGRFFACSTYGSNVYLWKESPTGYILHETLSSSTMHSTPLLSHNGESIIAFGGFTIQLWRTKGSAISPSSVSARTPQHATNFVLDFSPDGVLAVVARKDDNRVTVLDLKSGVPQLTIDTGMKVCGLRVIGDVVAVIGDCKAIAWDLPTGNCAPSAKVTLEDSTWTINFGDPPRCGAMSASISPNSCHIAFSMFTPPKLPYLDVYNVSTGEQFTKRLGNERTPWFAPDGCDLWLADDDGSGSVLRVGGEAEMLQGSARGVDIQDPPEGYPWGSSRGYRVTSDWWVLGPDGKRLLMLPPPWQSHAVQLVWKGRFLALLHGGLPEPVILEVDQ